MFKIMLIVYRYIFGYIRISIEDTSSIRLFNMLKNLETDLWNIKEYSKSIEFNILIRDFKKNKRLFKKADVKWKITDKRGLPFLLYRNRHKKLMVLGVITSFFVVYYMSGFIWSVNITGNYSHTADELNDILSEINVKAGVRKSSINGEEIEKYLRNKYFDITWVSVEIKGTIININIRENFDGSVFDEISAPCHIIATKDGVINSIVTRNGVPLVKAGDTVKKGDILISGTIEVFDDYGEILSIRNEKADGDVYIDVVYDYNETINRKYNRKIYTGNEKEQYFIDINNRYMCIKAGKVSYEKYDVFTEKKTFKIGDDFIFPIGFYIKEIKEVKIQEKLYSDIEMTDLKDNKINEFINMIKSKGAVYIKSDIKYTISDEKMNITGKIYATEPAIKILEII